MKIATLDPFRPEQPFPDPDDALDDPDGLLAIGGCLSPQRLINAYHNGIFPWYNPGEPILWWSPNPRLVLFPDRLQISRSLNKTLRKNIFDISYDRAFADVINACAAPRHQENSTWISPEMNRAYNQLHQQGIAHSVEAWHNNKLVGGLYGLAIGQVFFGESMFHIQTDASKVAFVHLVNQLTTWNYQLIDCQVHSNHLVSLGAEEIDRADFNKLLKHLCQQSVTKQSWQNR